MSKRKKTRQIIRHRFEMFLAINPGEVCVSGRRWRMSEKEAVKAAIRARPKRPK